MNYGTISTWRMSFDGLSKAFEMIKNGEDAGDAVTALIKDVEDYPYYKSVGYGGLPNKECVVELDAAYMDGNNLQIGAIAGANDIKNPIDVAKELSKQKVNNMLIGEGAYKFAKENNFEIKEMLTDRAKKMWSNKKAKLEKEKNLKAYDGHDTVCGICLDKSGKIVAGTSTSGLFMKEPGRMGDSPLCGCGFYADSNIGAAAATGLGEDIAKGVLSYEVVRKIAEGMSPQDACDKTLYDFQENLIKRNNQIDEIQISLIAMDKNGNWGVSTTVEFTFCIANEEQDPKIYISWQDKNKKTKIEDVSQEWLDAYEKRIHAEV